MKIIRKITLFSLLLFAVTTALSQPVTDPAFITRVQGTEQGYLVFQERCMNCHGKLDAEQAPLPETLQAMPAQRIYDALTSGAMQVHVQDLSDGDVRRVVEAVSGERLGSPAMGDAANMPNRCAANPEFKPGGPSWNGWSNQPTNTRLQNAGDAGLNREDIPKLKLMWAFGFAQGISAFSQPSVTGGRLFIGSDSGYVYSLDPTTGCVYWSFRPDANVRSSISVGLIKNDSGQNFYAALFGDLKANIYALDAHSGELIWKQSGDDNLTARVTASPVLHEGVLYVPMSSWEEAAARALNYSCCTFQGSVAAYAANSGKQLWKTYTLQQRPQPTKINSAGTQLYAPAGAAVWNTPVIDPQANAVYFGTGDAFTYPAPVTSDAIMALDMDNGEVLWSHQVHADDAFLVGCKALPTENCPAKMGPDWDMTTSVILKTLDDDRRALIVATRPGEVLSLDPDSGGKLNWRVDVSQVKGRGMIWGGAADDENAYFGLTSGGMVAVSLLDGKRRWFNPLADSASDSPTNNGSAVSMIDGVAFIGGLDGRLHAVSTEDGSTLWQYNTNRSFETINGIEARGGSIMAAGPIVADGLLFATSGYQVIFGIPGNVLLAFAVDNVKREK